ncbi:unnamed protein product [Symbiodinium natans]|uniref:Uncharacterized protein n=1 Tax=Symbiodinium natans TaxID=878477 RepID=A0A812U431_9DINO|nr:unnamed protein product [Symbiodinium natans]
MEIPTALCGRDEVLPMLRRRAEIRAKGARPFLAALCREVQSVLPLATGPQALSLRRVARQAEWQAQNYSFDVNNDLILLTEGCELERDAEVTELLESLETQSKEAAAFCMIFRDVQDRLKKELQCMHVAPAPAALQPPRGGPTELVAEQTPARLTQASLPGLLAPGSPCKASKLGALQADISVPTISYSQAFRHDIVESETVPIKNWDSPLELPLPGQLFPEEPMVSARSTQGEAETASEGTAELAELEVPSAAAQEASGAISTGGCEEDEEEEEAVTPSCASDHGSVESFRSAPEVAEDDGPDKPLLLMELGSQSYELICSALPCKELYALRVVYSLQLQA